MNEIVTELSKPIWWFSVVIAGIIINLVSSYLKISLDSFLGNTLSWWRKKSESRTLAWNSRVEKIKCDAKIRNNEIANEFRHRLGSILIFLLSLSILTLPVLLTLLLKLSPDKYLISISLGGFAILTFLAFLEHIAAEVSKKVIEEADKAEN